MQIVIDIDDRVYEMVMNTGTFGTYKFNTSKAIQHGTPLPKGHGRLIDVYEYFKKEFGDAREFLDKATTIIEADTESEGEDGKDKER